MRRVRPLVVASVVLVLSAMVGGGPGPIASASTGGGHVFRAETGGFGFTNGFDPVGEYIANSWGLYTQLLVRNLVTFRHVAGAEGNEVVPDLATDLGTRSEDGLTYTFHLKAGAEFAPPVSREITSADIEFAFERINRASLGAQYGFYYDGVIQGMTGQASGFAPISGIETPDDRTIVFHLTQPVGDFQYRLAMPAAGAVPREVARCFREPGTYGRDLVASGPYMIEGSGDLDISSCSAIEPMVGFDPEDHLFLVRNPNYDPATDSSEVRENRLEGIRITVTDDWDAMWEKIASGELDASVWDWPSSELVERYLADPELRDLLKANSSDTTWYVSMNLLVPPFDDVHVRRAANWVLDKGRIGRLTGPSVTGSPATHVFPPDMISGFGETYDPYATTGFHGNVAEAKAEMAKSRYDGDHDGVCDADECRSVLALAGRGDLWESWGRTMKANLARIGVHLELKFLPWGRLWTVVETVDNLVPIVLTMGWGKDYPDPYTFAVLFHSVSIACEGQVNVAEVGMTKAQAKACGVLPEWRAARPPSLDAAIDRCQSLALEDRTACWADLDRKVMERVVPWVPIQWANALTILSPNVTDYEYDQFSAMISLAHIGLSN